jgi:putative PIN family toxin of toxin-antitoxin system
MRIVFDTNIYIAAALRGSFAEDIIKLAKKKAITLLTSKAIIKELRSKLLSKFSKSEEDVDFFINTINQLAENVEPQEQVIAITRDPDDNKILECALTGKADLIVSADQDLIALKKFKGIAIIHPKTLSYTFPAFFKKRQ